jgi:hypothetical protein
VRHARSQPRFPGVIQARLSAALCLLQHGVKCSDRVGQCQIDLLRHAYGCFTKILPPSTPFNSPIYLFTRFYLPIYTPSHTLLFTLPPTFIHSSITSFYSPIYLFTHFNSPIYTINPLLFTLPPTFMNTSITPFLFTYLFTCFYSPIYTLIHPLYSPFHPSTSIHPSINPLFIHHSITPLSFIHLSVHPSTFVFTNLSIHQC